MNLLSKLKELKKIRMLMKWSSYLGMASTTTIPKTYTYARDRNLALSTKLHSSKKAILYRVLLSLKKVENTRSDHQVKGGLHLVKGLAHNELSSSSMKRGKRARGHNAIRNTLPSSSREEELQRKSQ